MIFESHAHYDDVRFNDDREEVVQALYEAGITKVMNASSSLKSAVEIIKLCDTDEHMYGSVGVHPHDVQDMHEKDLETLLGLSAHEKVLAIGEIGLDYYYDNVPKEIQKLWFREQVKLAIELDLPLIIHSRDAAADTIDILTELDAKKVGGVIHCFSQSAEMAKRYIELGFYIGVGGVITFKNAKEIKAVVEEVSLDRILIETDSPYLAPVPNRGKRNDSRNLTYIIEAIAQIKGVTPKEVEDTTYDNAMKLFQLD